MTDSIERGNIYWVNLDPVIGSEIKKKRPCVIIGATPINKARRTVVAVPLSTGGRHSPPLTVQVNCLGKPCLAVCDQIRAIDKSRLAEHAGRLTEKEMEALGTAMRQVLSLN
jgi:mRNA interferase MazF